MTGWISKPGDAPSPESSAGSPGPRREQAAQAATPSPSGPAESRRSEPAVPPIAASSPAELSGAGAAAPGGEGAPAADPSAADRPDEGPEINRKIIDVIKTCYDPEIPVNIYELGLIYDVKVDEEDNAHVKMTLTAPNCPAAQSLPAEVKHKIEAMDEIKSASVEIVFDPPWNPNKMSDSAKLVLNIL